jgi:heme/copper-type cytochrome/quinol oxidase subunit 2
VVEYVVLAATALSSGELVKGSWGRRSGQYKRRLYMSCAMMMMMMMMIMMLVIMVMIITRISYLLRSRHRSGSTSKVGE